jgi:PKD repeat protein
MKIFFLSVVLLIGNVCIGQQNLVCGTTPRTQEVVWMQNAQQQYAAIERDFLQNNRRNSPIQYLPLSIHIVRETNGTGGISLANFQTALDTLNSFYSNANIQFFVCDNITYIDNTGNYNFSKADDITFTATNNIPNLINIYFFNSIINTSGGGLCGYASFPGGNDRIMMTNSCAMNGSTLAHEMGHFLGLYHTHGKSNTGTTDEFVNGSNCTYAGDDICDTDADPNLSGNVDVNCIYTGAGQDLNGAFYTPDPFNIMSYSQKFCRTYFSPMQFARTYMIATMVRNYFVCPAINADFGADVTYTCSSSLTVNFSDSSIGATGWEWDIDSDGIVDYTGQNVTHTYFSPGDYSVYLKVVGTGGLSSRTKVNLIQVGHTYNMPYLEDFETFISNTGATGLDNGWTTSPKETPIGYRWNPNTATTPSGSTGPGIDNTLGTPLGHYMFTEATSSNSGDVAIFTTPCIVITGEQPILEFYTHRYGSNMGNLHLDIYDGTTWINDIIPTILGQSQALGSSPYSLNIVDLTSFVNQTVQVRFRAIRGNGYRGDMALDDVRIYDAMLSDLEMPKKPIYHLQVSPNPSNGEFVVQMHSNQEQSARMFVYNTIGVIILEQEIQIVEGANHWQLNLSMLPVGAYILNIQSASQQFVQRLIRTN